MVTVIHAISAQKRDALSSILFYESLFYETPTVSTPLITATLE